MESILKTKTCKTINRTKAFHAKDSMGNLKSFLSWSMCCVKHGLTSSSQERISPRIGKKEIKAVCFSRRSLSGTFYFANFDFTNPIVWRKEQVVVPSKGSETWGGGRGGVTYRYRGFASKWSPCMEPLFPCRTFEVGWKQGGIIACYASLLLFLFVASSECGRFWMSDSLRKHKNENGKVRLCPLITGRFYLWYQ